MTVHEKDPATTVEVLHDHLFGLGTLASTKRDLFTFLGHVRLFSETFETSDGIRTLRQDEDKRCGDRAIFVRLSQVEHRRFDEWLSKVLNNEVLNGKSDLVRAE